MSERVKLKASDGQEFDAYVARPAGTPIAGLVVVQEIFGVNAHIRSVADGYAKDGFLAVAPAIFDRVERGVDLTYEGADREKAMSLMSKLNPDDVLLDIDATVDYVREQTGKKTGVIGYCFGGSMAWVAATRLKIDAAVGYYGGHIINYVQEEPKSLVMLHFGKEDAHIPKEVVDKIAAAHPEVEIYSYDGAGHGFNCDMRSSYNAPSSKLARERSLAFLKKNLASL